MIKKKKYYVVWDGREPGIYDSWAECQRQVEGVQGAKYKSFESKEAAIDAYRGDPREHLGLMKAILRKAAENRAPMMENGVRDYSAIPEIYLNAIAVDGACAGNPGRMEYRAVRVIDGAEIFHVGATKPLIGTNNIAEYLAMIHLAALLQQRGDFTTPIYTDSRNTFSWLRRGASKTTLEANATTAPTLDLLRRADAWLAANGPIRNPILKWKTDQWGEIPADFGRK